MNHNFIVPVIDTDSVTLSKHNGGEFTIEEIIQLTKEINELNGELINWEFEFYIPCMVVVKSKNYILYDGTKIKTKGSSIRDTKKELALREMMNKVIEGLVYDATEDDLLSIYHDYIREALNVKDIKRWCQKKTVTKAVVACKDHERLTREQKKEQGIRSNETVVWDAIKNEESIQEGDRYYLYPAIFSTETIAKTLKSGKVKEKIIHHTGLKQDKVWENDHDSNKLLQRIFDTMNIFSSVIDIKRFTDYTLIKNRPLLEALIVNP